MTAKNVEHLIGSAGRIITPWKCKQDVGGDPNGIHLSGWLVLSVLTTEERSLGVRVVFAANAVTTV